MAAPRTVPSANTVPLADDKPQPTGRESVAATLTRCKVPLIADWLKRTKRTPELNHLHLSDEQRTGHLPKLVDDIVKRLDKAKIPSQDSDATASAAAVEHGNLRRTQGYSSAMLIHESRILQVTIFGTLHENLTQLDFNLLLPDVMIYRGRGGCAVDPNNGEFQQCRAQIGESIPCEAEGVRSA